MLDGSLFSTKAAYKALHDNKNDEISAAPWGSKVPSRVKIFGWMLHLNRSTPGKTYIRRQDHRLTQPNWPLP
jgi:hypothetical protein